MNIDIERINFTIPASGTIRVSHRTRKGNNRIIGVCLQAISDSELVGSTMGMFVDKKEIFPYNFDPSLLSFSQKVPVNDRFYNHINALIEQSNVDVTFTGTVGYSFSLLLKCEQDG